MRNLLIFDVETTGLDCSQHSIVQFSALYEKEGTLSGLNLFSQPLRFDNVSVEALEKQNVTIEQLQAYPSSQEAFFKIRNFLRTETVDGVKLTPVGYNVSFDLKMLEALFAAHDPTDSIYRYFTHKHVDIYEVIKLIRAIGGFADMPNLKLESFFPIFGEGVEGEAHDAAADIAVTYRMFRWIEEVIRKGLAQ